VQTVRDPLGNEWEIYISRTATPDWQEGSSSGFDYAPMPGAGGLFELPLMLLSTIWSTLLLPLLRLIVRTPGAVIKGRRSHAARIQAIQYSQGARETRTWTTTLDQARSVVNDIANGIEEGKIVQPAGTVYLGERDD
jgi:hypothetical protein